MRAWVGCCYKLHSSQELGIWEITCGLVRFRFYSLSWLQLATRYYHFVWMHVTWKSGTLLFTVLTVFLLDFLKMFAYFYLSTRTLRYTIDRPCHAVKRRSCAGTCNAVHRKLAMWQKVRFWFFFWKGLLFVFLTVCSIVAVSCVGMKSESLRVARLALFLLQASVALGKCKLLIKHLVTKKLILTYSYNGGLWHQSVVMNVCWYILFNVLALLNNKRK